MAEAALGLVLLGVLEALEALGVPEVLELVVLEALVGGCLVPVGFDLGEYWDLLGREA